MRTPDDRIERWDAVRRAMRDGGVVHAVDGDEKPPPGLVTRVVTRVAANHRADGMGLVLWRRWCLGGAALAVAALGLGLLAMPEEGRNPQFVPVPELDRLPIGLETPDEMTP